MNKNRLMLGLGVAILLAALVGCLDFDEQKAYLEYDEKNDRLILVITYLGLHEDNAQHGGDAETQLKEAIEKQTVAFGSNFPFTFQLKKLRADLRTGTGSVKGTPEPVRKNLLALLERVELRNGGFYIGPGGRVCGAQVLTIEKIKDSMRLANAAINEAVLASLAEEETLDAWQTLVFERAQKNHVWVRLKGHSLIISVPMPEDMLMEGRQEFVENMFGQDEKEPDDILRALRQFLASPVFVWHEDDMLTIKWGLQSKPPVLVLKPRQGEYKPNLKEHVAMTYGFHLDENLAHYLLWPDAPAKTAAKQAAQIMAPRLTKVERVRVIVRQLKNAPSKECWAKLRREEIEDPRKAAALPNEELLELWQEWLEEQAPEPEEDEEEEDEEEGDD